MRLKNVTINKIIRTTKNFGLALSSDVPVPSKILKDEF
jgi:hypothetical protein